MSPGNGVNERILKESSSSSSSSIIKLSKVHRARRYTRSAVRKRRQTGSPTIAYGDLWMCDRSQRLQGVPFERVRALVIPALYERDSELAFAVNLRKEWLCKESAAARPIRFYTRGYFLNARASSSPREIRRSVQARGRLPAVEIERPNE